MSPIFPQVDRSRTLRSEPFSSRLAIFELPPIVRKLLGHNVGPARHIATDCGPEDHALTDMEFMRHYGAPSRMAVSAARPLSVSAYAPLLRLCATTPRMAMDCIASRGCQPRRGRPRSRRKTKLLDPVASPSPPPLPHPPLPPTV